MDDERRVAWVARQLTATYGEVEASVGDPVETLVLTILSQNTNDRNRDRAYRGLMERFGDLAGVRKAEVTEIAEAVRPAGLHQRKASHISGVLARITAERGGLDLSFLADLSLGDGLSWLLESPGVGKKTAGIVLLFSFGKPYFPVDTHIRRVMTRLGVIRGRQDPHDRMNGVLPADAEFLRALHLHTIRLGREYCHPQCPECPECPLGRHCSREGVA